MASQGANTSYSHAATAANGQLEESDADADGETDDDLDYQLLATANTAAINEPPFVEFDIYDPDQPLRRHALFLEPKPARTGRCGLKEGFPGVPSVIHKDYENRLAWGRQLHEYQLCGIRTGPLGHRIQGQKTRKAPQRNNMGKTCLSPGKKAGVTVSNDVSRFREHLKLGLAPHHDAGALRLGQSTSQLLKDLHRGGRLAESLFHNVTWPINHKTKTFQAPEDVRELMQKAHIPGPDTMYPVEAPQPASDLMMKILKESDIPVPDFGSYMATHPQYAGYEPRQHAAWIEGRDCSWAEHVQYSVDFPRTSIVLPPTAAPTTSSMAGDLDLVSTSEPARASPPAPIFFVDPATFSSIHNVLTAGASTENEPTLEAPMDVPVTETSISDKPVLDTSVLRYVNPFVTEATADTHRNLLDRSSQEPGNTLFEEAFNRSFSEYGPFSQGHADSEVKPLPYPPESCANKLIEDYLATRECAEAAVWNDTLAGTQHREAVEANKWLPLGKKSNIVLAMNGTSDLELSVESLIGATLEISITAADSTLESATKGVTAGKRKRGADDTAPDLVRPSNKKRHAVAEDDAHN